MKTVCITKFDFTWKILQALTNTYIYIYACLYHLIAKQLAIWVQSAIISLFIQLSTNWCSGISFKLYITPAYDGTNIDSTWTSFLSDQDTWIQELIQNTFYDDIIDLIVSIQTATSLIAVSDDSTSDLHMTFGWVLAQANGTSLVKGYSRCNDRASTSMRAEAAGMLATFIFLGMLQKYTSFYFKHFR